MIELRLDKSEVEAGDTLMVEARVLSGGGKIAEDLLVQVGWRTEGRGNINKMTVYRVRHALKGELCAIPLPIPPEGPISFDGKLIRIVWEVAAQFPDQGGAEPPPIITTAFRVLPRRVRR